jgi:Ran GTPase-activating protein (RanGAP) involved in mRNA processing and transport
MNTMFIRIKKINFDHNNLSKRCLELLADGVIYSNSLTVLSLNHNNMDNDHAKSIADILKFSTLKMLFIAWNKIRSSGGEIIFNAMADNQYMQVFDISFNSLAANSMANYGNSRVNSDLESAEKSNA